MCVFISYRNVHVHCIQYIIWLRQWCYLNIHTNKASIKFDLIWFVLEHGTASKCLYPHCNVRSFHLMTLHTRWSTMQIKLLMMRLCSHCLCRYIQYMHINKTVQTQSNPYWIWGEECGTWCKFSKFPLEIPNLCPVIQLGSTMGAIEILSCYCMLANWCKANIFWQTQMVSHLSLRA